MLDLCVQYTGLRKHKYCGRHCDPHQQRNKPGHRPAPCNAPFGDIGVRNIRFHQSQRQIQDGSAPGLPRTTGIGRCWRVVAGRHRQAKQKKVKFVVRLPLPFKHCRFPLTPPPRLLANKPQTWL